VLLDHHLEVVLVGFLDGPEFLRRVADQYVDFPAKRDGIDVGRIERESAVEVLDGLRVEAALELLFRGIVEFCGCHLSV
jgi:hypothetical protein